MYIVQDIYATPFSQKANPPGPAIARFPSCVPFLGLFLIPFTFRWPATFSTIRPPSQPRPKTACPPGRQRKDKSGIPINRSCPLRYTWGFLRFIIVVVVIHVLTSNNPTSPSPIQNEHALYTQNASIKAQKTHTSKTTHQAHQANTQASSRHSQKHPHTLTPKMQNQTTTPPSQTGRVCTHKVR